MKTCWLKGLDADQKEEIELSFKSSIIARKRLKSILEDKLNSNTTNMRQKVNYELSSWPLLQADALGYERALHEVIKLITD